MSTLSIRTAMQSPSNPFAMSQVFDFGGDIGPGQQVVAYAVAMSGFMLNYQTNSPYWAENAGMAAVSLVPNLVGNLLHVDGNVVLTDFDGDSARAPADGATDPASGAWVTALAVIDSSPSAMVLGNAFGLPSGQDSNPINVGANTGNQAFLAGFAVQASQGNTGSIAGLSITSSVSSPVQDQVKVDGTVGMSELTTTGTVDVGLLSIPSGSGWNFEVQPAAVTWGSPDGQSGMTGALSATFNVPSGQSITQAALLLQSVDIVYGGTAEFQMISALQQGALSINGSIVTGSFNLNIYNPDFGAREYISSSSSASIYVIAQFG